MAIHSVPDNNPTYMEQTYGTVYLITDPRSNTLLEQVHRECLAKLKERKTITDSWTI